MIGHSMEVVKTDKAIKHSELDRLISRDKELDILFERIYEDNASGKISDKRFSKMSAKYEREQGDISPAN